MIPGPVPEPNTVWLALLGLIALGLVRSAQNVREAEVRLAEFAAQLDAPDAALE
jgi:hypothetical protein